MWCLMCQTGKETSFADNRWSILRPFYFSLVKVTRFLPINFFFHRITPFQALHAWWWSAIMISKCSFFSYFCWKNGESVTVNAIDVQHAMAHVQLWQHNPALTDWLTTLKTLFRKCEIQSFCSHLWFSVFRLGLPSLGFQSQFLIYI